MINSIKSFRKVDGTYVGCIATFSNAIDRIVQGKNSMIASTTVFETELIIGAVKKVLKTITNA